MTPPKRVTRREAADILGLHKRTVDNYALHRTRNAAGVEFPAFVDGTVRLSDLKAWARDLGGQGGRGTTKKRDGQPCQWCRRVVERRRREPLRGHLVCQDCNLGSHHLQPTVGVWGGVKGSTLRHIVRPGARKSLPVLAACGRAVDRFDVDQRLPCIACMEAVFGDSTG